MRSDFSKAFLSATAYLPDKLWRAAFSLTPDQRAECEEIRIRTDRSPKALVGGRYISLTYNGELIEVSSDDVSEIVTRATGRSVHTYSGQINSGFVTTPEGHRIGLVGEVNASGDDVHSVRNIACVNIRIAKPYVRLAEGIIPALYKYGFESTLIISPPGAGKTTLLRDMTRLLSMRYSTSIVDERYEIAGNRAGRGCFDVGDCDVLSGAGKSASIETLLRAMSPQIIALDEITQENDVETICRCGYCGCRYLATAHASDPEELNRRPIYKRLMESEVFGVIIFIKNHEGKRQYSAYVKESAYNAEDNGNIADSGIMLGNRFFAKQEL
jgi:stage III sporulation protein AA